MQGKYILRSRLSLSDRFWEKVDRSGPAPAHAPALGSCWLWLGAANLAGYGVFGWPGRRSMLAHRASWLLAGSPLPRGLFLLHMCDTPACVNPTHLRLGTHRENMEDMRRKGRSLVGDRNSSRQHPERMQRGDAHWTRRHPELLHPHTHAKVRLTVADVRAIRTSYAAGGVAQATLATAYGVARPTISGVIHRRTWKHV